MAPKKKSPKTKSYSPDGETRQDYAAHRRKTTINRKTRTADAVPGFRDYGDGIGDVVYSWRDPYGRGSLGISPQALRVTAYSTELNNSEKADKRRGKKVPKSKLFKR